MTATQPRVVLLGVHRWRRLAVLQFVEQGGFEPLVLLYDTESIPASFRTLGTNQIIRQSLAAPRSAKEIADLLSNSEGEWFVLALDDYVCEFAAELAAFSKKPTMRPSAARQTLEKHKLRGMWNALCETNPDLFPVPFRYREYTDTHFRTISQEDGDPNFSETAPLIVKPDALDASIGIQRATSWVSVGSAIDAIREEVEPLADAVTCLGIRVAPGITAEHQIPRSMKLHPGAEFSAEFLSAKPSAGSPDGHFLIGITQKYINPSNFVEIAHCFPSEAFPKDLIGAVQSATSKLLEDLDVRLCISHWEYVVTEDGRLALVEAQLRPGGDWIMNLITEATDRNPYSVLLSFLGKNASEPPRFSKKRVAAVFFPLPEREIRGQFSIVCEPEAQALRGMSLFIDDELSEVSKWQAEAQWHSRFVTVISTGADFEECKAHCELILSRISIVCRNDSQALEEIRLVLAS